MNEKTERNNGREGWKTRDDERMVGKKQYSEKE